MNFHNHHLVCLHKTTNLIKTNVGKPNVHCKERTEEQDSGWTMQHKETATRFSAQTSAQMLDNSQTHKDLILGSSEAIILSSGWHLKSVHAILRR